MWAIANGVNVLLSIILYPDILIIIRLPTDITTIDVKIRNNFNISQALNIIGIWIATIFVVILEQSKYFDVTKVLLIKNW